MVDIHVGARLKQMRLLLGLTQRELGAMLERPISPQQMQKYERGTNRLSASRIWEFSRAMGIRPATFFEGL